MVAVHACSEALRAQLAGTGVEVTELAPPAVAGHPEITGSNPHALDLGDYLDEMTGLPAERPARPETLVKGVLTHRWAERDGTYADRVAQRSEAPAGLPGR